MNSVEWEAIARWEGLLWLAGIVGGYLCFVLFQPYRWAFGASYRILRGASFLWIGVGLFGVARECWEVGGELWRDEISPAEFLSVGELGYAPVVRDLARPAFDGLLEGLLRMGTVVVEAWPLSMLVAVLLLLNAGGCLGVLVRREGEGITVLRVGVVVLVVLAALTHLGDGLLRWRPSLFVGGALWARGFLAQAGGLFPFMTGFAVLVWVFWWMARLGEGWREVLRGRDAVAKAGTLIVWPVLMWGVLFIWRGDVVFWDVVARNVWVLVAIATAWGFLVALILFSSGEVRMRDCLFRKQWGWWLNYWERMIWWGFMVILHLFLLELCAVSAAAVLDGATVAAFGWSVFLSLLKGAVYVWLLGALVRLVNDLEE
ncbi:MAG: hypothetical protein AAGD22_03000 [Verrucomicrobiota bacterium]